jgi:hypothetical protein
MHDGLSAFSSRLLVGVVGFALVLSHPPLKAQDGGVHGGDQRASQFLSPGSLPRLALVIGEEDYDYLPPAVNAMNDAVAASQALDSAGFSSIHLLRDATAAQIYSAVSDFAKEAGSIDTPAITVFYFAGHGFQSGYDYLVPRDARSDANLGTDSIAAINIVNTLATRQYGLSLFFFDACRTQLPGKAPGFAAFDPPGAIIIGLASSFNKPALSAALDGDADSPYTTALTLFLPRPALSLQQGLEDVSYFVSTHTHGTQQPWVLGHAFSSAFYFMPSDAQRDADLESWRAALATNRAECVRYYMASHPSSLYLWPAQQWLYLAGFNSAATESAEPCSSQ